MILNMYQVTELKNREEPRDLAFSSVYYSELGDLG